MALEKLEGKRILHENNKTYYSDFYTGKTYLLRKNDEKKFRLFEMRYLIVLALMMAALAFSGNLLTAVIAGVILFVAAELSFYFLFLKQCIQVDISSRPEGLSDQVADAFSPMVILMMIVVQILLAIAFGFLAMHTVYEIIFAIFCGVSCIFLYLTAVYGLGLVKKVRG